MVNTETKTTKKQPKKTAPKVDACIYRDRKYIIQEHSNGKVKLTDGVIHFWVKEADVERN